MGRRRTAGAQLLFARSAAVLVVTIVILVSQTAAKPESGHRQVSEILADDASNHGTDPEYTEDRGRETFPRDASASFSDTTSRLRRDLITIDQLGYTYTPGAGIHKFHTEAKTWDEARSICKREGGDLAIINSDAESKVIKDLFATSRSRISSDNERFSFIGFNYKDAEGHWVTVDGRSLEEAGFALWKTDEPNNEGGLEYCGSVYGDGRFNDIHCFRKLSFVCELPINEAAGPAGLKGERGEPGERGPEGRQGVAGEKGSKGDTGAPGSQGLPGPTGKGGDPGPVGSSGSAGPKGDPGVPGIPGLKGEPGVDGLPGPRGPSGLDGQRGPVGPRGPSGLDGQRGPVGPPGPVGPWGPRGVRGPVGLPGVDGERGFPGPPGLPGESGIGYDAACLAILLNAGQGQNQGPDSLIGHVAETLFGRNITKREQKEMITNLCEQLKISFQNSVKPNGQRESPAKSCNHLFAAYPDKPSGEYWIDPNDGDVGDAILVRCDVEDGTTCVKPRSDLSENITFDGRQQAVWLSEVENGMQITYEASSNQINALQLLSSHAEQNVIYNCIQSADYSEAPGDTSDPGLELLAWTGVVLQSRGNRHFRYDVVSNECQQSLDGWKDAKIIYRTDRPALLPIVDIGMRDVGRSGQRASVKFGEVCFR